jgi:hypothetical protein
VTIGQKDRYNAARLEERQRDHSLYIAFAPADAPRIAVAAIVETPVLAAHAAPIVRRVFDYWLLGEYPSEEDMAAVRKGQASAPLGKPRPVADVPPLRLDDDPGAGWDWLNTRAVTIMAAPPQPTQPRCSPSSAQAVSAANTGSKSKDDGAAHGIHALLAPGLQRHHHHTRQQAQVQQCHQGSASSDGSLASGSSPPRSNSSAVEAASITLACAAAMRVARRGCSSVRRAFLPAPGCRWRRTPCWPA